MDAEGKSVFVRRGTIVGLMDETLKSPMGRSIP